MMVLVGEVGGGGNKSDSDTLPFFGFLGPGEFFYSHGVMMSETGKTGCKSSSKLLCYLSRESFPRSPIHSHSTPGLFCCMFSVVRRTCGAGTSRGRCCEFRVSSRVGCCGDFTSRCILFARRICHDRSCARSGPVPFSCCGSFRGSVQLATYKGARCMGRFASCAGFGG